MTDHLVVVDVDMYKDLLKVPAFYPCIDQLVLFKNIKVYSRE